MNNEELKALVEQAETASGAIIAAFESKASGGEKVAELEKQLAEGRDNYVSLETKLKEIEQAHQETTASQNEVQEILHDKLEKVKARLANQRELNAEMVTKLEEASQSYDALLKQRNTDIEEVDKVLRALAPLVEGE